MLMIQAPTGCVSPGPASIPPPRFHSAQVRLDSPAGRRIERQRRARLASSPAAGQPLPKDLRPDGASRPWTSIVLHHTATPAGSVAEIDEEHRRRKDTLGRYWLGIGYHFVIGNGRGMTDGAIEPTFRWRQQLHGAHAGTRSSNEHGIGICLVGDFNQAPPTAKQIQAAKTLVDRLRRRYAISRDQVVGHGDIRATDCPGRLFPFEEIVGGRPRGNADPQEDALQESARSSRAVPYHPALSIPLGTS